MTSRDQPSLAGLDLNLLIALQTLLDTGSVTRAAEKLGVSQSAMSHTLRRLRDMFGDPLLVRSRTGMVFTERAEDLRAPLAACLRDLQRLVQPAREFDPRESTREFVVSATDFISLLFLPQLVALLQRDAPGIQLRMSLAPAHEYGQMLERGDLDLTVGGSLLQDYPGLMRRELKREPMLCAARREHPRVRGALTLEAYLQERHLLVAPASGGGRGIVDELLAERGLQRTVAVCVPSFLIAPHVLAESDLLLTAPRALIEAYVEPFGLQTLTPPLEIPPFPIRMLWHERAHVDPAARWLRAAVLRACRGDELEPP